MAPRREPRSPRRRSPSAGATSSYLQVREKPEVNSYALTATFLSGIRAPTMFGAGAPSTGSLPAGVVSPQQKQGASEDDSRECARAETQRGTGHMKRAVKRSERALDERKASNAAGRHEYRQRPPPPFTGLNPRSLLLQTEQFFLDCRGARRGGTTEDCVPFGGSPLEHFNATAEKSPGVLPRTWDGFKPYLIELYGPVSAMSVVQDLKKIRFTGNFRAVVDKFQDALAQGDQPSERQLVSLSLSRFPL